MFSDLVRSRLTVTQHNLMSNFHSENEAQTSHTVDLAKVCDLYLISFFCSISNLLKAEVNGQLFSGMKLDKIRIILTQPSPLWKSYGMFFFMNLNIMTFYLLPFFHQASKTFPLALTTLLTPFPLPALLPPQQVMHQPWILRHCFLSFLLR
jgi:hypothetical protein